MNIEFGLTEDSVNTQCAPLAVLSAHYQHHQVLEPLAEVALRMKIREISRQCKLKQVLLSILVGCETLTAFNSQLGGEAALVALRGWERFADQSTLSRTLDALSLMNIVQLRTAKSAIWRSRSRTQQHDWCGYLFLDFDLTGLPCSPQAQASQQGYFSGKNSTGRQFARVSCINYHEIV